jgi:hypothetical protein
MIICIRGAAMTPAEIITQSAESVGTLDVSHVDTIRALMEFYESGQIQDEEESEVDLMIQLSGMVYNDIPKED